MKKDSFVGCFASFVAAVLLGIVIVVHITVYLESVGAGYYCKYCSKGLVVSTKAAAARYIGSKSCTQSPDSLHELDWYFQSPDSIKKLKYIKQ